MRSLVRRVDVVLRDARVDLGRAEVGVPEHRLDRAQIGPVLEEVRRERVPHLVGRDRRRDARRARVALDDLPDGLAGERASGGREKQRR